MSETTTEKATGSTEPTATETTTVAEGASEATTEGASETTTEATVETTTTPVSRDELLDRMDHGWAVFEALVGRVPPDQFSAPTSSRWALASMLAHVAAWHDETTHRLYRYMATGHQQPPPNEGDTSDDAYNARVVEETRDRSPDQILHSLRRSHARLRGAVAELDARLDDGWIAAIVGGNTYEHYAEHQPELEAAVSAQA
jgi:hypothetical protein